MTDQTQPNDTPSFSDGATLNGQPIQPSAGVPPYGAPGQPLPGQPHGYPQAGQQYAPAGGGYPYPYPYQGQAYQPGPGYGGYPRPPRTNVLAILSLIAPFVGLGIAGLVMGPIALAQIKKTGDQGRGLAIAGTIVSAVSVLVAVIVGIAYIAFVGVLFSSFGIDNDGTWSIESAGALLNSLRGASA